MVTQYLLFLKHLIKGKRTVTFLADPDFQAAMEEARNKLQSGTARWHSYYEVYATVLKQKAKA